MRSLFLLPVFLLASLPAILAEDAPDEARLAGLDAYWAEVSRAVGTGDFAGYKATCHPEGVLVSGSKRTSQPLAQALARWKPEFMATKAGTVESSVEFRFSQRFNDDTTAHETGIFLYSTTGADGKTTREYIHFEGLLLRTDRWRILMEYQKSKATKEEWDALKSLPAADTPNVVFILSDNQSFYEMSCHGHAQIKTPRIDRLAAQSVEFTRFYAPPYCSPSRSVILTGQHAMRSGVHNTIGGRSILHRDQTTLADILKKHGYHTAIFGKWHLGFSYPHRPQDRGFDEVFVHRGGGVGQMEDYYGNTHYDTTFIHNGKVTPSQGFSTDTLFRRAMDYVAAHRSEPFFCFVSTPVTHSPHHGPEKLVAELKAAGVEGDIGLFAQVQNLDENIGRMLARIDSLGLADNTIVIYASDQGMNDRGAPHGANRLGVAYDPAQHAPFFIRVPGAKPAVSNRLAGMIDFFPTILDLCGITPPEDCDGISLKPLVLGAEDAFPADRTLIIQCPRGRTASKWKNASVKTERWRLVEGEKLYDIDADPRQKTDVAAEHPEVVRRLRAKYEAYWADLPDQSTTLSRHLLGAKECPDVMLNGSDWYTGSSPWASSHMKPGKGGNGTWAVTVLTDGRYEFECRHFPREADKAIGATHAKIQIGDVVSERDIDAAASAVRFELDLKAGDYDLQAWLGSGPKSSGPLFLYVSAK